VFWPPVGSFVIFCGGLFCCRVIACANHTRSIPRSFLEKVTELNTESVSVVKVSVACLVWLHFLLFLVALVALVTVVLKVEMDPVERRSSCSFVMVSTGVIAPDISSSNFIS